MHLTFLQFGECVRCSQSHSFYDLLILQLLFLSLVNVFIALKGIFLQNLFMASGVSFILTSFRLHLRLYIFEHQVRDFINRNK